MSEEIEEFKTGGYCATCLHSLKNCTCKIIFDYRDGKCKYHDEKTCDCKNGNCMYLNPPHQ